MKVTIIGTLELGSQLYSQCLRDIMRLASAHEVTGQATEFVVDDSQAGLLASKLLRASQHEFRQMPTGQAIACADLVVCYLENPEKDGHYEERAYEAQSDEAEVVVRAQPDQHERPKLKRPAAEPYADFKRAFALIEKRIRPIPTRGPQLWREIELRPNGGKPWFYI